jgi:hypothetical protein
MKGKQLRSHIINTLFLSGFFVVLVASFVRYYYLKEFPIYIEVQCDPATEICFHQDCSEGDCPPNNLEDYRLFSIPGYMHSSCYDIDRCASVCKGQNGICTETICGSDPENDTCSEAPVIQETATTTDNL